MQKIKKVIKRCGVREIDLGQAYAAYQLSSGIVPGFSRKKGQQKLLKLITNILKKTFVGEMNAIIISNYTFLLQK